MCESEGWLVFIVTGDCAASKTRDLQVSPAGQFTSELMRTRQPQEIQPIMTNRSDLTQATSLLTEDEAREDSPQLTVDPALRRKTRLFVAVVILK